MKQLSRRRGDMLIAASAIGFGVGTALSVVALRTLRPADLLAVELLGSALVLGTFAVGTGRLHRNGALRALAQGAVNPGLSFLLGDLGLARTTATSGSLLLGTDTVLTVLLAVVVLRDRLDRAIGAALVLGLGGTALVSFATAASPAFEPDGSHVLGNLLVVGGVLSSAAYVVWSRWSAADPDDGLGVTAWQFIGAAAATSPFPAVSWAAGGSRILHARPEEIVAAAAVLVCGLAALTAFNRGIGAVTASRAGLLFSLQPVAGVLTGVTLLGEPLGGAEALGGALIVVGVLLVSGRPADDERRSPRDRRTAGAVAGDVRPCVDCS